MSGFISGQNDSAVKELISQVKDGYVLEQVAAINCAGFTDDSALPTNLETRFRGLKSLPVSSSSKKLLSRSKSMASYSEKKNRGNMSSASAFSIRAGESCPLDSSVEETQIFSGIKRNPSLNSPSKVLTPTTQTMKLLVPKEKSRISSSSLTSIDLASLSSSDQDQKERMKKKSKFLTSWFDKLSLAQAMGCLPSKSSSSNSKKTKESIEEEFEKVKKRLAEESKQRDIMVNKSRRLRSKYLRD